jgi:hypothetical protein
VTGKGERAHIMFMWRRFPALHTGVFINNSYLPDQRLLFITKDITTSPDRTSAIITSSGSDNKMPSSGAIAAGVLIVITGTVVSGGVVLFVVTVTAGRMVVATVVSAALIMVYCSFVTMLLSALFAALSKTGYCPFLVYVCEGVTL